MWTCAWCGRQHDDQFDACYHCGTSKRGKKDPDFHPVKDVGAVRSARSRPQLESLPTISEAPAVQTMNQNSVAPSAGQVGDASTAKPDKPPLPSRWWIVVPCLLAGIAIAAQAWSILGHLDLLTAGNRLPELRSQTVDLETQISSLTMQRSQLQSDLAKSGPTLDDLRKQTAIENTKLADAETKREQAEKDANEKDAEAKVLAAACKMMTARLDELKQERAKLDAENRSLDARHTELLAKVGSAEGQLKQLAGQITSATSELKRINDDISKQQETLAGLVTQVGTKTAEVKQLTDDRERLGKENAKLTSDNAGLQTTYDASVKRVAELEAKLKGIADDIRREDESLSKLRSQAEALGTSIQVLGAELVGLQTKVDDKKKELQDLATQIETQTKLGAVKAKEFQSSGADLKAKLEELNLIADRISRAKVEEASLLKRLADLRPVVDRKEPAQPVEALSPPPATPATSKPDAAKPADGKTPPSTPEPKEPPKE